MRRRLVIVAASGAFMWLITTVPVWAGNITQISTPTKAYIGATDPINFAGADGALFNKISGGGLTVTFSNNPCTPPPGLSAPCVVKLSVPDTWGTWGCPPFTQVACVEFTPKQLSVLWSGEYTYVRGVKNGVMPIDMITMTLSKAESVFGFEAEPDSSTKEVIAATYLMGNKDVGTIKVNVDGNGGARLVAVSSTMPFNKVVVTETATNDFAIANIRFAAQPLPEPASILLLLSGVAGLGVSKRRRTKKIDH